MSRFHYFSHGSESVGLQFLFMRLRPIWCLSYILQKFYGFVMEKFVANLLQTRIWDRFATDYGHHFFPRDKFFFLWREAILYKLCNGFITEFTTYPLQIRYKAIPNSQHTCNGFFEYVANLLQVQCTFVTYLQQIL